MRDVLLIPTSHVETKDEPSGPQVERAELAPHLTLERLPDEDAELVINACSPRGHFFIPVRGCGQLYSFILEVDPAVYEDRPYTWDEDHLIFYAMVLSRLIRDNGYSLEYAARIVDHEDGARQVIPFRSGFLETHRLRNDRDWLTASEACALRSLLAAWLRVKDELPWRVVHPLNVSEDAIRLPFIERALLLIVIGLEGLLRSQPRFSARQFRTRLPKLADEVGIAGVDESYAKELYKARSEAAHGAQVWTPRDQQPAPTNVLVQDLLPLAQDLLRAAIRRAIEDAEFRAVFRSDAAVDARWPIPPH
ncbi:MAG: hypothetical protein IRZ20_01835 [Thermoleophilia bacterium]|nr:hypothetical protein [Thermoleophilia bacterium]